MFIEFIKRVGENDKRRGLPSIVSRFHIEFNQFNNTGARMLDSILKEFRNAPPAKSQKFNVLIMRKIKLTSPVI